MKQEQMVREILKEWYPTFDTHWEKTSNCPCKDCADYRINKALSALLSLIEGALPEERLPNPDGIIEKGEEWFEGRNQAIQDCIQAIRRVFGTGGG